MAVDFNSILSRPVESAEKPKPKAPGTYFGSILKYELGESANKKTPYVRFTIGNVTPGPDVDVEVNQQNNIDLSRWSPYQDFFLTEDSLYRLREFLESLNLNVAGRGFNECLPETKNCPVQFMAFNEPSTKDPLTIYTNIKELTGAS